MKHIAPVDTAVNPIMRKLADLNLASMSREQQLTLFSQITDQLTFIIGSTIISPISLVLVYTILILTSIRDPSELDGIIGPKRNEKAVP